jgi:hypothetical protein
VEINATICEAIEFVRAEAANSGVSIEAKFVDISAPALSPGSRRGPQEAARDP